MVFELFFYCVTVQPKNRIMNLTQPESITILFPEGTYRYLLELKNTIISTDHFKDKRLSMLACFG